MGEAVGNLAKAGTKMAALRRSVSSASVNSTTFVVATDGSRHAMRAVRLAAYLCNEATHDKIRVITVVANGINDPASLLRNSEVDLRTVCNIRPKSISSHVLTIPEGSSLQATIWKAADDVPNAVLVMGSAGKNLEDASTSKSFRAHGQAPIGSVAMECLTKCHRPVVLAKELGTPCIGSEDGMLSRREGKAPGVILVAVDGSPTSRRCFDLAYHFARPGDTVRVVHVLDTDQHLTDQATNFEQFGSSAVGKHYTDRCLKSATAKEGVAFRYDALPKRGSIKDTLLAAADDEALVADLIILGSIELTQPHKDVYLGSVSAAVAKRTPAHTLIAKHFA